MTRKYVRWCVIGKKGGKTVSENCMFPSKAKARRYAKRERVKRPDLKIRLVRRKW